PVRQLVVRVAPVHRVTGDAGEAALPRAARFEESVVLAPGHPNGAVVPEVLIEVRDSGRHDQALPGLDGVALPAHEPSIVAELAPGPEACPFPAPGGHVLEASDAVALPAHLRRRLGRQAARVDDRGVGGVTREVLRVAARRVRVGADVIGPGTVAGFAANAE